MVRVVTQEQSNRDPKLEGFNAAATGTKREQIALKICNKFYEFPSCVS